MKLGSDRVPIIANVLDSISIARAFTFSPVSATGAAGV
jgi:hypothetical protein